jgi:hypothetical protein
MVNQDFRPSAQVFNFFGTSGFDVDKYSNNALSYSRLVPVRYGGKMLDDNVLRALPGQVILEPQRPQISSVLIADDRGPLPPSATGTLLKVGAQCDPRFVPGVRVLFVPHGGTLLATSEGQPERMVLPADQILGTVED